MIRPLVGGTIPAMALNSVVLPAPLGPMMARRWPRGTDRLTPSTARSASKATTTSVSVRIGSGTNAIPSGGLSGEVDTGSPFGKAINYSQDAAIGPRLEIGDGSGLLDALERARIGRLLQVGLRIVCPELRDVRIGGDRHVPEFTVAAFHDLADIDVVDWVAVGIELDGLPERRAIEFGLQYGVDEGLAVFHFAAHLLQHGVDPHHAGIHRETVERRDLAVLRLIFLDELLRHRIVRTLREMRRRDDALAFLAKRPDHRLVGAVHRGEQRRLRLQAETGILLDKAGSIRAGLHREDRIDLKVGELAEIGAEIRRVERMPELLHDLATAFGEHLGEPAALLVAEGVVLADGCDLLVTLLQRPIAERMGEFTGAVPGDADHVLDTLALGQVVSSNDRNEVWRTGALDVVGNRQSGVGEQITDQHVAIALLDQAACFLQGGIGVGGVVLDHQFDLAATHLALDLIEIELHALDHLLAARCDNAGERREQTDLDRAGLRLGTAPRPDACTCDG